MTFALEAMLNVANNNVEYTGRNNPADYIQRGYVASENSHTACSLTLSYAYDDSCISSLAQALGYEQEARIFANRSQFYKNVWDPKKQFFCPRSKNGTFDCPLVFADGWDKRYTEGDAWHYRFFVPGDIEGLINLFGGPEKFVIQLDEFAHRSEYFTTNALPNPWYWAGNEHDLMSLWMFNNAGRPDKTQMYTRYMLQHRFLNAPDGLPGNDDYGTMSAWYIFAALGFYPRAGSAEYFLGAPLFEKVRIQRSNGCVLEIIAHNWGEHNIYVSKFAVNGQEVTKPFLDHKKHLECTTESKVVTMEFWMDNVPHY
jgi:predicted alpha-1,2-mannosidase